MKKEKVPEKNEYLEHHIFRSFPHSNSKRKAADCRPELDEAREYSTSVRITRGGKGEDVIPDLWDDKIPEKVFKWAVKPKGRSKKGGQTIRRYEQAEEQEMVGEDPDRGGLL